MYGAFQHSSCGSIIIPPDVEERLLFENNINNKIFIITQIYSYPNTYDR